MVTSVAVILGAAFLGSAAAAPRPVGVAAAGGVVTVSGSASAREMLSVVFDPAPCATTLKAERRRPSVTSWGGIVDGAFRHSFGAGDYLPHVARYVCVFVQTIAPNPVTLAHASTPLV